MSEIRDTLNWSCCDNPQYRNLGILKTTTTDDTTTTPDDTTSSTDDTSDDSTDDTTNDTTDNPAGEGDDPFDNIPGYETSFLLLAVAGTAAFLYLRKRK